MLDIINPVVVVGIVAVAIFFMLLLMLGRRIGQWTIARHGAAPMRSTRCS